MLLKPAVPGYYPTDETSVAWFLVTMILVFTALSTLFLLLLFVSKLAEMSRKKKRTGFTPYIDKALLGILFEGYTMADVLKDPDYRRLSRKRFFRMLLIENTLRLHASFAGDYQHKLEKFYIDSGLQQLSLRKMRSLRWHMRCEGVNELSRMHVAEAFPKIKKLSEARNETLKQEALVGLIRLRGTEGLMSIADHTGPINDWIQLNILTVVKNAGYTQMPDFGKFLASANESVVVLGIRLSGTFGQIHHLHLIHQLVNESSSRRILTEGRRAMEQLSFQPYSSEGL